MKTISRLATGIVSLMFCAFAWADAPVVAPPAVGRVVFAVGQAQIERAGKAQPLALAVGIEEGDWIITGADAHVHLRMQDDAFVAVRPQSRLHIRQYRYQPADPAANAVLLHLEGGTARTVSGRAGEANRARYRFTTPVAAIGLRGTDYVVLAAPEVTRVSVLKGAITLNPLGAGCAADLAAPCLTPLMRELDARNPNAYLELRSQGGRPEIRLIEQSGQKFQERYPEEPRAKIEKDVLHTLHTVAPTPSQPPVTSSIAWGRWQGVATPTPTVVSQLAAGREIAFANEIFGLLRPAQRETLPRGTVDLNYAAGEAWLKNSANGALLPVALSQGELQLDFDRRQFTTQLEAALPDGAHKLHAQGQITFQGDFFSDARNSSMNVSGLVAQQGKEAGYIFDSRLPVGSLYGATYWKP